MLCCDLVAKGRQTNGRFFRECMEVLFQLTNRAGGFMGNFNTNLSLYTGPIFWGQRQDFLGLNIFC